MTEREKFIILVDNEKVPVADAIILLEGDGFNRIDTAVKLYLEKFAPIIVFSGGIENYSYGSIPSKEVIPIIVSTGIPEKDILIEDKSLNTREQAVEIIKLSIELKWKKIILVASHYHQYRAFLTFLKVIKETCVNIVLYNFPARELNWFSETGWGSRIELLESEFEKIEKYSKYGHISTFKEAIEYQKWKEELN